MCVGIFNPLMLNPFKLPSVPHANIDYLALLFNEALAHFHPHPTLPPSFNLILWWAADWQSSGLIKVLCPLTTQPRVCVSVVNYSEGRHLVPVLTFVLVHVESVHAGKTICITVCFILYICPQAIPAAWMYTNQLLLCCNQILHCGCEIKYNQAAEGN